MRGDVIYYSLNSTVGSIVKMTDAIIIDKFVIVYVGTSKGLIGKVSNICYDSSLTTYSCVLYSNCH